MSGGKKHPYTIQLSYKNTICHVIDFFLFVLCTISVLFICFSSLFDFHFFTQLVGEELLAGTNRAQERKREKKNTNAKQKDRGHVEFEHIKWSPWSCFALDFIISAFNAF